MQQHWLVVAVSQDAVDKGVALKLQAERRTWYLDEPVRRPGFQRADHRRGAEVGDGVV